MSKNRMASKFDALNAGGALDEGFNALFGSADSVVIDDDKVVIQQIPIENLHDFGYYDPERAALHKFKPYPPDKLEEFAQKIKEDGVLNPILVREHVPGEYEILAGHQRRNGSKHAGLETAPCIVLDVDDDQAIIVMTTTNLDQRDITPCERGWGYRIELEARTRKGDSQNENKPKSSDLIAEKAGISVAKMYRYIRLTYLIPIFQNMVDTGAMTLQVGESISHLSEETQENLAVHLESGDVDLTPELAVMFKTVLKDDDTSSDKLLEMAKKPTRGKAKKPSGGGAITVKLPQEKYSQYFPGKNAKEIAKLVNDILEEYFIAHPADADTGDGGE